MKLKNVFTFFVPFISVVLLAGCSNTEHPVSVVSDTKADFTAVANSNLQIQDMGYGGGQLWAVTWNRVGSTTNYYLAQWSHGAGEWNVTGHYGVRCAVSGSGKCYHINSYGQIWWVTWNGSGYSYGEVNRPELNGNTLYAIDIGAGIFLDEGDGLRVIFEEPDGTRHMYFGIYPSGGGSVDWGVPRPTLPRGNPARISLDQRDAFQTGVVTNTGYRDCYFILGDYDKLDDRYYSDAALSGSNVVAIRLSKLWYGDQSGMNATNITAYESVAMTRVDYVHYVMWIDSNWHFNIMPYENLQYY